MKTMAKLAASLMLAVAVAGCASPLGEPVTMRGETAEAPPPKPVANAAAVPLKLNTHRYKINIYPGLDEKFDPNPTLTPTEFNELSQLDYYCTLQTEKIRGRLEEVVHSGFKYGAFEGVLGMLGTMLGFGSHVHPLAYLAYIGLTGAGGGMANGEDKFEMVLAVAQGYCMTGMVYKADELERKLRRIFITPFYAGEADLPKVSDKPAPTYPNASDVAPPPMP